SHILILMSALHYLSALILYTTLFRSSFSSYYLLVISRLIRKIFSSTLRKLTAYYLERNTSLPSRSGKKFFSKALRNPQNMRFIKDRKSTRQNSSHVKISYAVLCFKTK